MKYVAVCGAICCMASLLVVSSRGVELCSNPTLDYAMVSYTFSPSSQTLLDCDIVSPVWLASRDPCGPFIESDLCQRGNNICSFNVTQIENYFYYCCTSGMSVVDSVTDCIYVEICTTIIEDSDYRPPYSYFGETLLLYIQVYASSPPNQANMIFLHPNGTQLEEPRVSVYQPNPIEPRFSFEYSISVPSVREMESRQLLFTAEFSSVCSGTVHKSLSVPVIRREDTVVISTTTLPPTVQTTDALGVSPLSVSPCAFNIGLIIGVVVLVILLSLLVVLLIVGTYFLRRQKKKFSLHLSSGSSARPTSLEMHSNYLRLPSQDQTPSPAVQYVNCPPDQQPRHYGNHRTPMAATPQPPSSLALGYSQRSHTGQTPLIADTPDFEQVPPSHGQVVEAGYSSTVEQGRSNGEYATVGENGSQRVVPSIEVGGASNNIYSNTTISELANDVLLHGADQANQTNV